MGDYDYNRLFCIRKQSDAQHMPHGLAYRISMSCMRTYQSRNPVITSGFCRGMADASIYLCNRNLRSGICMEPLYCQTKSGKYFKGMFGDDGHSNDCFLHMAHVPVLSRSTTNDLLQIQPFADAGRCIWSGKMIR